MPLIVIALLVLGTYAYRVTGPAFRHRLRLPERLHRLLSAAAVVLLVALAATCTFDAAHGFAGWARPAGVLVGLILAIRRTPFPIIVLAAAATTAALRAAGLSR